MAQQTDHTIRKLLAEAMPKAVKDHPEQIRLARLAQGGDKKAKNQLLVGSMGLVVKFMTPFLPAAREFGLEASDLLTIGLYGRHGDGRSGVARAIDLFDTHRGIRFSTYAQFWIREALGAAMRAASVVRTPDTRPRSASPDISRASLDDLEPESDDTDTGEALDDRARFERLWVAVDCELSDRERYVIRRRYGRHEALLGDIGDELGITGEGVRLIEREAIDKLRDSGVLCDFADGTLVEA